MTADTKCAHGKGARLGPPEGAHVSLRLLRPGYQGGAQEEASRGADKLRRVLEEVRREVEADDAEGEEALRGHVAQGQGAPRARDVRLAGEPAGRAGRTAEAQTEAAERQERAQTGFVRHSLTHPSITHSPLPHSL